MNEDFLHYLWKFQKFNTHSLKTARGESLSIIEVGLHNLDSGPDFLNAQLRINDQLWAGNVEIHVRASNWYVHQHERDKAYDNVILHVVWEYDVDIFRSDNTILPTLELNCFVSAEIMERYQGLFYNRPKWINCEDQLPALDMFKHENWLERLFIERLEQRSEKIFSELSTLQNNWEALLFSMLCKSFGLKVNGLSFLSVAHSLNFSIIRKCSERPFDLESLLLGQAGLLAAELEEVYFNELQQNYAFQVRKYRLDNRGVIPPKFFRLRPSNFPTIRLSQLAGLYSSKKQLFSEVISLKNLEAFYVIFKSSASSYWDRHYNFKVESRKQKKYLSKKFVDLLMMNTIIPLKFCYAKRSGQDIIDELLGLAATAEGERNSTIQKFSSLGFPIATAKQTQALLELKTSYCDKNRCMECTIGNDILKS